MLAVTKDAHTAFSGIVPPAARRRAFALEHMVKLWQMSKLKEPDPYTLADAKSAVGIDLNKVIPRRIGRRFESTGDCARRVHTLSVRGATCLRAITTPSPARRQQPRQ